MEQLKLENAAFYRIKRGQTAEEVEKVLSRPVGDCFAGAVVPAERFIPYVVKPFDTYASVAAFFGADGEEIANANFRRPLYPTRVIYIPPRR